MFFLKKQQMHIAGFLKANYIEMNCIVIQQLSPTWFCLDVLNYNPHPLASRYNPIHLEEIILGDTNLELYPWQTLRESNFGCDVVIERRMKELLVRCCNYQILFCVLLLAGAGHKRRSNCINHSPGMGPGYSHGHRRIN